MLSIALFSWFCLWLARAVRVRSLSFYNEKEAKIPVGLDLFIRGEGKDYSLDTSCRLSAFLIKCQGIHLLGGPYYSLAKTVICGVGMGHDYSRSLLPWSWRMVRFLVPQESLNQAIEEGPLVLRTCSSGRSRRRVRSERGHPQGWCQWL